MSRIPLRLAVRPSAHPALAGTLGPGVHALPPPPDARRPALLRVPALPDPTAPLPLALLLHGSGGEPDQALDYLEPCTSLAGVLVLAPASHDYTWDAILGRHGHDIDAVNHALHWVFDRFRVDPARLAVAGFSDGASYALALGLGNGDAFTAVVAMSPGYIPPVAPVGRPRVFVSHGADDTVLPIERCSRRLVPPLQGAGYPVDYVEFDGGHAITPDVARRACRWMLHG